MSLNTTQCWNPYPVYKDSGVEWLGQLPELWEMKRLKFCVSSGFQYGANIAAELTDHDLPRYIRITDMNDDGTLKDDTFRSLAYEQAEPYLLRNKDILLARSGATVGKSFMYDKSMGIAAYAGYLIRISPHNTVNADYLYAFINSNSYWQWINSIFIQATIQNVSAEKYANLILPVPPLDEQHAIASFLDRECARIDSLIEKKRRLLELLDEKRRAVITQAVTRGLDPNVPMKESGVEWLGEVPDGWDVLPIKFVASIFYGLSEPPEYQQEGVHFIRATDIHAGEIYTDTILHVDPNDIPAHRIFWLVSGDIIIVRSGAYTGDSAIIPSCLEGSIAGYDMILRCKKIHPKFVQWALLSNYLKDGQINLQKMRAAQPHLNAEQLKICRLILPPFPEQHAIASYLDAETAAIDARRQAHEQSITLLQEYRASLITQAVTGKIDVREYKPEQ